MLEEFTRLLTKTNTQEEEKKKEKAAPVKEQLKKVEKDIIDSFVEYYGENYRDIIEYKITTTPIAIINSEGLLDITLEISEEAKRKIDKIAKETYGISFLFPNNPMEDKYPMVAINLNNLRMSSIIHELNHAISTEIIAYAYDEFDLEEEFPNPIYNIGIPNDNIEISNSMVINNGKEDSNANLCYEIINELMTRDILVPQNMIHTLKLI